MTSILFSEPITVITVVETVGDDGRITKHDELTFTKGAFRQRVAADAYNDGVVVTDEIAVYLPDESVVVKPGDQVAIGGVHYDVVSTDFPQMNFRTSTIHHREFRARRSTR